MTAAVPLTVRLSAARVRAPGEAAGYTMLTVTQGATVIARGRARARRAAEIDAALEARDLPPGPVAELAISIVKEHRGKGLGAPVYAAIARAVAPLPIAASSHLPDPWGKTSAPSWSVWRSAALADLLDVRDGFATVRPPAPEPATEAPAEAVADPDDAPGSDAPVDAPAAPEAPADAPTPEASSDAQEPPAEAPDAPAPGDAAAPVPEALEAASPVEDPPVADAAPVLVP